MQFGRAAGRPIGRIEPSPGGKLRHAGPHVVADHGDGQGFAPVVEQAHQIAVLDAPRLGLGRGQEHRLPSVDLGGAAGADEIELRMQLMLRLVGNQMQRPFARRLAAQPFRRFAPYGMARAIVVSEAGDFLAEDLELAGRRRQGIGFRIGAIGFVDHMRRFRRVQFQNALFPEGIEIGHAVGERPGPVAGLIVQMTQPGVFVAAFGGTFHLQKLII